MQTQSIVVYTPVENALYNGGMMIPLIGGIASGFVLFLALMVIITKVASETGRRSVPDSWVAGAGVVAVAVGALTLHHLIL